MTGPIGVDDRSDHQVQPVRPVEPAVEQITEASVSASREEVPAVPTEQEDEEFVDYEASPERSNMEINVVHFFEDYYAIPEEDAAHLDFGPCEAVFQKPKESDNHLKALYMRGHVIGKPISRMLVDDGAIVNLTPYLFTRSLAGRTRS